MLLFLIFTIASATVDRWFQLQPTEWARAGASCEHIAVMFSDATWLDLTMQTAAELRPACVALWLWLDNNSSAVPWCDNNLCFVDRSASHTNDWGTGRYFSKISMRVPIMRALIERLPLDDKRGIALVDSDIVFFRRNALARFEQAHTTLAIQQERPCHSLWCVNGGLWWVRRTEHGRRLLRSVEFIMNRLAVPDQDAFEVALAFRNVTVHHLDAQRFPNGWTFQNNNLIRNAHLVLLNWMPFSAKVAVAAQLRRRSRNLN